MTVKRVALQGINAEANLPKAKAIKFMAWRLKKWQNTASGLNSTVQNNTTQHQVDGDNFLTNWSYLVIHRTAIPPIWISIQIVLPFEIWAQINGVIIVKYMKQKHLYINTVQEIKQYQKSGYNTYRGWTQIGCQDRHWDTERKEEGTWDGRRRDGGTNSTLKIKEQKKCLTLNEHDDNDVDG